MKHMDVAMADTLVALEHYLKSQIPPSAEVAPVLGHSYAELARITLAGKHIRSRLVHIAAGELEGPAYDAAVNFGAAVNLLHGGFLVHDDFVDSDYTRRGDMSFHNSLGQMAQDVHIGDSLSVLAGDLALAGAIDLVSGASVPAGFRAPAVRIVVDAMLESIHGELSDVAHRVSDSHHTMDDVRLSNHRKTSAYTFRAPLMLGAVAAGRDPEPMVAIADTLGFAYQAADDVAGHEADIAKERVTMVTAKIAENPDVGVHGALESVAAETRASLARARELTEAAQLPQDVREGVLSIVATMDKNLAALGV